MQPDLGEQIIAPNLPWIINESSSGSLRNRPSASHREIEQLR